MKIAIFHNFLDNIGGAEIVTLTLARELRADVYSTVVNKEAIKKMGFSIPVQSIGWIPVNAPFRQQLAAYRFKKLRLNEKYDFYIISGDWAASGMINHKPNLWIIYSPPRELWDLYRHTRKHNVGWWGKWLFDVWVWYNRMLTKKNVQNATSMVAISINVQKRVKKFLGKDVPVIYPPTETKDFYYKENGEYWLSVNRLIDHKRIAMQIETFKKLPNEKLIIVGSFEQSKHFKEYVAYINSIKPSNVEIRSWIPAHELRELYASCKGFITTSLDEDYGMNVIEAMASGKPVIAPNEGGYKETVIHNETGILIDNITTDKLVLAIQTLKNPSLYKNRCLTRAAEFDTSICIATIKKHIDATLKD